MSDLTKEWLTKVANVSESDAGKVYTSKFDGSYITRVDMEDGVRFLAERGITEELTHGVGFSPKDGKWYGWSHRAIYGFKVGSTCKKGDCHYVADTPEALIDDRAEFFAGISQEWVDRHRAECQILPDRSGIRILHTPITLPVAASLDELEDAIDGDATLKEETLFEDAVSVIKCGRGEWVAQTMEDAKQMAIDFNEGVS